MPKIDVAFDFGNVQAATSATNAALGTFNDRIKSITSEVNNFNSQGVLIGSTIRGLTKDNQQFTASLKASTDQLQKATAGIDIGALQNVNIAYKKTTEAVDELTTKQGTLAEVAGRVGRAFQYFVAYRAFNFITDQIKEGITAANQFQIQLSLIRTLSQDNQMSFSKWGQEVRKVSDASGFDVNETGKAFYDAISNQVARGPQTSAFVQSASDLARVTGSSLTDSVNLLSSALNSYGLGAKDAERVSAVFFRTIDEGRVVASELSNVFGRVGVTAANLGISMEDVNATLAITTQKGFKTSDAMTLLTNLMMKLEKPTAATAGFFKELGVSTGEEANQLYGYTGVLRKMVELVRSGKIDVSAFFDEIRGRKQFGIFEQSIDEIEAFSSKLKNVADTTKVYNNAVAIRGESPADYFNKQWNTFKNIFKDDIGQAIIDFPKNAAASFNYFANAIDPIIPGAKTLTILAATAAGGFAAWGTAALFAASSTTTLGMALLTLGRAVPILAAVGGALYLIRETYNNTDARLVFKVDMSQLDQALEKVAKLKRERELTVGKASTDKEIIQARADVGFKGIAGVLAQAQIQNDAVLSSAKSKVKDLGETLRAGFAGYADTLKQKVTDLKKAITDGNQEIEKSKKSLLGFKDSLDQIVFNRQKSYATDEQKVPLDEARIQKLTARAQTLLQSVNPADRDEGRKLFDEVARMIDDVENVKQQIQFDAAKQAGAEGIFYFNTQNVDARLKALFALRNNLELNAQAVEKKGIETNTVKEKAAQEQLRNFQAGLRKYDNIAIYDNSGKIKDEYKTKGKFDPSKFSTDLDKIEDTLRANFSGTQAERQKFELDLYRQRLNYTQEAAAFERSEYIKVTQAKMQADQELFKSKLQGTEKDRDEALSKETTTQQSLKEQAQVYRQFAVGINEFLGRGITFDQLDKMQALRDQIVSYETAVGQLNANKTADGFRPQDIQKVKANADNLAKAYKEAYKAAGLDPEAQPQFLNKNGAQIQMNDVERSTQDYIKTLNELNDKIKGTRTTEKQLFDDLQKNTEAPLATLKQQFPDLATAADNALKAVTDSATKTANDGIQPLIDKLNNLKEAFDNLKMGAMPMGDGEISSVIGGDAAYAATGGVVGQFPGQPKGQDRYPIWAAKDERIFDANTSRQHKSLFDAIAQRRMPQYMAQGGVVGSNNKTMSVGDIHISVQSGKTNEDTARVIGNRLERQLRLGNINLK